MVAVFVVELGEGHGVGVYLYVGGVRHGVDCVQDLSIGGMVDDVRIWEG